MQDPVLKPPRCEVCKHSRKNNHELTYKCNEGRTLSRLGLKILCSKGVGARDDFPDAFHPFWLRGKCRGFLPRTRL